VPAGIAITIDHSPEAQRWKEVPLRQFHIPSVLQGPVKPTVVEPEDDEFDEGTMLGVESAGIAEVARDEAALATAAEVVATTDVKVVAIVLPPLELPTEARVVGVVAAAATGLDVTAGAEFAGAAAVDAFGEDEPLPPMGKQLVPTGFA
jgi:hypothetical protein